MYAVQRADICDSAHREWPLMRGGKDSQRRRPNGPEVLARTQKIAARATARAGP